MDPSMNRVHSDSELVLPRRCYHCSEAAQIECLICLKANVRPVPCFCSQQCYQLHWTLHKRQWRNLSTIKSNVSSKAIPSFQTTSDFTYSSVHPQSLDDRYLEADGHRHYSPDFHPLDEAQESWINAADHHYHPYVMRQYLMSMVSNETMPHS